jgi:hypothetical protein
MATDADMNAIKERITKRIMPHWAMMNVVPQSDDLEMEHARGQAIFWLGTFYGRAILKGKQKEEAMKKKLGEKKP